MLSWITSFWSTQPVGPARNAPNDGVGIKKIIENKPAQVVLLSNEDVVNKLNSLKPIPERAPPSFAPLNPLTAELGSLLTEEEGGLAILAALRELRARNK